MRETNGFQIVNRIDYALSQQGNRRIDLSKYLGIQPSNFTMWKNRGSMPSADTLFRISEYLKVSIEWLLYGEDSNNEVDKRIKDLVSNFELLAEDDKQNIELMIEAFLNKAKVQNQTCKIG